MIPDKWEKGVVPSSADCQDLSGQSDWRRTGLNLAGMSGLGADDFIEWDRITLFEGSRRDFIVFRWRSDFLNMRS